MTFKRADILLPNFSKDSEKMKKWSVVACDQYTSEPDYWKGVEECVGDSPSTFRITVPEIYLNDADIDQRIKRTNAAMDKYMAEQVFEEYKNTYIFVERTLANGVKRLGIMGAVDLEDYDYSKESQTKIRATEGTVVSRIPPRLKVRKDAPVELPHIMMLIDDDKREIIEKNSEMTDSFEKLYDFDLMQNSGHIAGYKMSEAACARLEEKLSALDDIDAFNKKYDVKKDSPLIFAMGDGNHSLAAAKSLYCSIKEKLGDGALTHPARYALCEIVSIYDDAIEFEPIHRIVKNVSPDELISALSGVASEVDGEQKIRVITKDSEKVYSFTSTTHDMTVGTLQNFIDEYIVSHSGVVCDYIHGEDELRALVREDSVAFMFDGFDKSQLFSYIKNGPMPRKTFSMGDAKSKRYYLEGRVIVK